MTKGNNKNVYIHTLNNKMAFYIEGKQICYADNGCEIGEPDLKTIREQQILSQRWRKEKGWGDDKTEHGYMRVKIKQW